MASIEVVEHGRWSGGGAVVASLVRELVEERSDLFLHGAADKSLLTRNVPALSLAARGRIVYMPQNAWAWSGPIPFERRWLLKHAALRLISRSMMHRADAVVRLSEAIPEPRNKRCLLLPNVLDVEFETALDRSNSFDVPGRLGFDRPFVLVPGSVTQYRNVELAVESHRRWPDRDVVFVGAPLSPKVSDWLSARAADSAKIHYIREHVDRSEVLALLRAAHLTLFPSFVEASPVSTAEAAALGVPVLASDIPGHRQFVPDECLFPLSGMSPEALGARIARCETNRPNPTTPADRAQMRAAWRGSLGDFLEMLL